MSPSLTDHVDFTKQLRTFLNMEPIHYSCLKKIVSFKGRLPSCIGLYLMQSKHRLIYTWCTSLRRVSISSFDDYAELFVRRRIQQRYTPRNKNSFHQMVQKVKL